MAGLQVIGAIALSIALISVVCFFVGIKHFSAQKINLFVACDETGKSLEVVCQRSELIQVCGRWDYHGQPGLYPFSR